SGACGSPPKVSKWVHSFPPPTWAEARVWEAGRIRRLRRSPGHRPDVTVPTSALLLRRWMSDRSGGGGGLPDTEPRAPALPKPKRLERNRGGTSDVEASSHGAPGCLSGLLLATHPLPFRPGRNLGQAQVRRAWPTVGRDIPPGTGRLPCHARPRLG